jgi:hypothetical protein
MQRVKTGTMAIVVSALWAATSFAQAQSDPQAGAQLGEQSALAGKQAQGANTEKTTASSTTEGTLASGSTINAELTNGVDSKKAKVGDTVAAKTTDTLKSSDGRIIVPKGSKLVGHVTQASARGGGQANSTLGLVFDKAILKSGQEMPLNVVIQAVAAPQASAPQNDEVTPMGGMSPGPSRGAAGGATSTAGRVGSGAEGTLNNAGRTAGGGVDSTVSSTSGASSTVGGGLDNGGQLTANSRGVYGLSSLSLSAAATDSMHGAVITSTGKNVHLDSGTRVLLVATDSPVKQPGH